MTIHKHAPASRPVADPSQPIVDSEVSAQLRAREAAEPRRVGGHAALAAAIVAIAGVAALGAWSGRERPTYRSQADCIAANPGHESACERRASSSGRSRVLWVLADNNGRGAASSVQRGGFGSTGRGFASGG